jgi:hypothetical protein
MVFRKMLGLLAAAALSQACAGISVEHDFDPQADYAAYQSWDWLPSEGRRVDLRVRDPAIEGELRAAIEGGMEARGLRKVASGEPAVRVGYRLVLDEGLESWVLYEPSGSDWRYRNYGPARTTTHTGMLTVGTLVIDIFDTRRKELVWRGIAEGDVRPNQPPEKRRARINEAVRKILAEYPPGR